MCRKEGNGNGRTREEDCEKSWIEWQMISERRACRGK